MAAQDTHHVFFQGHFPAVTQSTEKNPEEICRELDSVLRQQPVAQLRHKKSFSEFNVFA